jgi:hypothetical protein
MDMDEGTIALTIMTGLVLITFGGLLVWGICSGQFKNVEDAKYQIFRYDKKNNSIPNYPEKQISGTERGDEK